MFIPKYFEDLKKLHENTLPPHAYFVPDSVQKDLTGNKRIDSDRFVLLNGDWRFQYYSSIYDLNSEIEENERQDAMSFNSVDFSEAKAAASGYDVLPVPSTWQMHGYGRLRVPDSIVVVKTE